MLYYSIKIWTGSTLIYCTNNAAKNFIVEKIQNIMTLSLFLRVVVYMRNMVCVGFLSEAVLSFYCFIIRGLWWQYCRKKSEAGKTAKIVKKISASKSPNLPKKEPSPPENAGLGTKPRSGSYNLMPAPDDQMVRSNEDLESVCIIILFSLFTILLKAFQSSKIWLWNSFSDEFEST